MVCLISLVYCSYPSFPDSKSPQSLPPNDILQHHSNPTDPSFQMPPSLHFIRHAEGHHNLSQENQNIRDPLLTAHGEVQCAELAREIGEARMKSIDYIVASPLQRTLNTALCIFQKLLKEKPGLKIIALPELQETSLLPCDVGSPIEQLLDLYKDKPVDFSLVGENWIEKTTGAFSPHSRHLSERCKKARHFLRQQDKAEIAVVTHGALLHYLTEDWHQAMAGCGTGWSNCELRTYHFDTSTEEANANASIVEVYPNLVLRGPRSTLPSSEEQRNLQEQAERQWDTEGYIILSTPDNSAIEPAARPNPASESILAKMLRRCFGKRR